MLIAMYSIPLELTVQNNGDIFAAHAAKNNTV